MGELVIVSRAPTGEGSYCIIGEWTSLQKLIEARPQMIAIVDTFRDDLEDLGAGFGVTDPVSGDVIIKLPGTSKPRRKKPRAKPGRGKRKQAEALVASQGDVGQCINGV
jgi:hypothetical protein